MTKKLLIYVFLIIISASASAQFGDDSCLTKMLIKPQFGIKTSTIAKMPIHGFAFADIVIHDRIYTATDFVLKAGMWYDSDTIKNFGFDICLGVQYTFREPFYIFTEIRPRTLMIHTQTNLADNRNIGDEITNYILWSNGVGYAYKVTPEFYLFSELGINSEITIPFLTSDGAIHRDDIKLFFIIGILFRNF